MFSFFKLRKSYFNGWWHLSFVMPVAATWLLGVKFPQPNFGDFITVKIPYFSIRTISISIVTSLTQFLVYFF
jgi:hypothetical protein